MMKNAWLILIFIGIGIARAFADIAPNPIQAKGIVTACNTDIRMVSERVMVDLYKDSSVVECHFYMKNEGKDQQVNIGFPEMNFHHFLHTPREDFKKLFTVSENGKAVWEVEAYVPERKQPEDALPIQLKSKTDYQNQPWYLWNSSFKKGEVKMIKVRYSLPTGVIKSRCNYFTYLLNTGAGWKGNIDSAEVIVNLKDISNDLVLKSVPGNYQLSGHQISWKFSDLEPTINDDVKIYFERSKGMYEKMKAEKPFPIMVFNEKVLPEWDVVNDIGFLDRLTGLGLLDVKIQKDTELTQKYTSGKEAVVIIYTKEYAVDKISRLLESRKPELLPLAYESALDFMEKYKLVVDQSEYAEEKMLLKILELEEKDIRNAKITSSQMGKSTIELELKD